MTPTTGFTPPPDTMPAGHAAAVILLALVAMFFIGAVVCYWYSRRANRFHPAEEAAIEVARRTLNTYR